MTTQILQSTTSASASYATLRYGGTPPAIARVQLGLDASTGLRLERTFRRRTSYGVDAMKPRFARHGRHVAAVLAQGGYPTLRERQR